MKKKSMVWLILIWLTLITTTFLLLNTYYNPLETYVLDFDVEVKSGALGFNLDEDKLHFGTLSPGGSSGHQIRINNQDQFKKKISFSVASSEKLISWFWFNPHSDWIIEPEKEQKFQIQIYPPDGAKQKMYEGKIIINVYRALPWSKNGVENYKNLEGCFSKKLWEMIYCKERVNNKNKI